VGQNVLRVLSQEIYSLVAYLGIPVDSGFATGRQSRERASAQRESTEVDRIRNGATNFVTGLASIENDMIK
jgi:hypothetical protein